MDEGEIVTKETFPVFIDGYVKWDGCVNFTHPSEKNCMSHECGNPAVRYSAMWDAIYSAARKLMPKHEEWLK